MSQSQENLTDEQQHWTEDSQGWARASQRTVLHKQVKMKYYSPILQSISDYREGIYGRKGGVQCLKQWSAYKKI